MSLYSRRLRLPRQQRSPAGAAFACPPSARLQSRRLRAVMRGVKRGSAGAVARWQSFSAPARGAVERQLPPPRMHAHRLSRDIRHAAHATVFARGQWCEYACRAVRAGAGLLPSGLASCVNSASAFCYGMPVLIASTHGEAEVEDSSVRMKYVARVATTSFRVAPMRRHAQVQRWQVGSVIQRLLPLPDSHVERR